MKIAFIVDVFPNLTSDTFILNQITGLLDRGCEVDIYARTSQTQLRLQPDVLKYNLLDRTFYYNIAIPVNKPERVARALGLFIRNFGKNPWALLKSLNIFKFGKEALSLKLLYSIIPFLGKGPYDIIHCHFGPNGDMGVLLKMLGVFEGKVITTFHGYDIRLGLEKGKGIYQRLFKEGDFFMPVSRYNYDILIDFGADKDKIIHHTMGIDLSKFPFKWQTESFTSERPLKILTIARLVKIKALENGIKAIHMLLRERRDLDLEYNIVGDGHLAEELNKLVKDLNLDGTVHLLGPVDQDEVAEILKKSDIFILPSLAECLSVVLMEAQAVGLPVITSDVGGVRDVVAHEDFRVPAGDVAALARKLAYVIDHRRDWPEMAKTGRKHIEDNFDINKLNDRLIGLFKQFTRDSDAGQTHAR